MRVVNLQQGSAEWLGWRLGGIGGSDAPAILGQSPYATREQLLDEKVRGTKRETNFAMRRGTRMEPIARSMYERKYSQVTVQPLCVQHDDCEWLMASLDGLVMDNGEPVGEIEIKCWKWQNHDMVLAGCVPTEAVAQIQHQLLVAGLDWCDLVSFSENEKFPANQRLAVLRVEADAEFQATLLGAEEQFWSQVLAGREAIRGVTR